MKGARGRKNSQPALPLSSPDLIDWKIALAKVKALPAPFDLDATSIARVDVLLEATVQAWAPSFKSKLGSNAIKDFIRYTTPSSVAFNREEYRPFLQEVTGDNRLSNIAAILLARLVRDADVIANLKKECQAQSDKEYVSLKGEPPPQVSDKDLMKYERFEQKMKGADSPLDPLNRLLAMPAEDGKSGLPVMLAAYLVRLDAFILQCYATTLDKDNLKKLREIAAIAQLGIHGYSKVFDERIKALADTGKHPVLFATNLVNHTCNRCTELVAGLLEKNDVKKFVAANRMGDLKKVAKSPRSNEKADVKKLPAAAKVKKLIARSLLGELLPEAGFSKHLRAVKTSLLFNQIEVTQESVGKNLLIRLGEYASTLDPATEHGRFVRYLHWAVQKPFSEGGIIGESARLAETMATNVEVAKSLLHDMEIDEDAANHALSYVGRHYPCLERVFDENEMKSLLQKLLSDNG